MIQGLTLAPLVRLLKLDGDDGLADELTSARRRARTAPSPRSSRPRDRPPSTGAGVSRRRDSLLPGGDATLTEAKRALGLVATRRQRERLEALRAEQRVGSDAFIILQEELDFAELALSEEQDRHIEES